MLLVFIVAIVVVVASVADDAVVVADVVAAKGSYAAREVPSIISCMDHGGLVWGISAATAKLA